MDECSSGHRDKTDGNARGNLWRQGSNLKDLMTKNTFYRHRRKLLEQGIDITMPPNNFEKPNNVVPLMKIIEATPVSIPLWAYEKGLIAA